jgi:hypothetical protein
LVHCQAGSDVPERLRREVLLGLLQEHLAPIFAKFMSTGSANPLWAVRPFGESM